MMIRKFINSFSTVSRFTSRKFSSASESIDLPTIDFQKFLNKSQGWEIECKNVAECLRTAGILVVRDPNVDENQNKNFIKMMEKYFDRESKIYYRGLKIKDAYPELHYQVGATPEYIEKAKDNSQKFDEYSPKDQPVSPKKPVFDSKWRFFWNIGERDKEVDKDALVYPNVLPEGFPQWESTMNGWGNKMLNACEIAARMAALGFSLPEPTFTDLMKHGGHLLAPTGSDLGKFNEGTIFAGYHYDLNFLTIHGKSNYGGLFIWLRNGKKVKVRVPDGCLLLQSGIQFEYLTGGEVLSGYHEVYYTEEVKEQIKKIVKENENKKDDEKVIPWRISSTLFSQIRQNVVLEPLLKFKNEQTAKKYPPILTRDQVAAELRAIGLF